jgi:hypothetical protein
MISLQLSSDVPFVLMTLTSFDSQFNDSFHLHPLVPIRITIASSTPSPFGGYLLQFQANIALTIQVDPRSLKGFGN